MVLTNSSLPAEGKLHGVWSGFIKEENISSRRKLIGRCRTSCFNLAISNHVPYRAPGQAAGAIALFLSFGE